MFYLAVTRLKLKSYNYLIPFLLNTYQIVKQIRASENFLQGKLMATPNLSMWTMSLWCSEESVRKFYLSGSHQLAMGKISDWSSEAVHVTHATNWNELPHWNDVTQMLNKHGKFVLLTHPSEEHLNCFIPQPNLRLTLKF